MADMHTLDGNDAGQVRVVMHFDVPAGNNAVGVSWADALVNSGVGGTTALPDGDGTGGTIHATEKTAIQAGTVYEFSTSFDVERAGTSPAEIRDRLRREYASNEAEVVASLQKRLNYFGHTEARA